MNAKHLMLMTVVTVSALSMNSCKEDMPYLFSAEEEYTRNFIKTFGVIDPAQDWNLAQAAEVTVNAGDRAASVKVYCKVSDKYYIVADLKDVSGSVRVPIDVPEGCNDLMVKIDGKKYYTTIGGTVDPAMSRAYHESDNGVVKVEKTDEYFEFSSGLIDPVIGASGVVPEGSTGNEGNLTMHFSFTASDKPLMIYPMYWCSSDTHTIGIYYYNDDKEMVTVDIYTDKGISTDHSIQKLGTAYYPSQYSAIETDAFMAFIGMPEGTRYHDIVESDGNDGFKLKEEYQGMLDAKLATYDKTVGGTTYKAYTEATFYEWSCSVKVVYYDWVDAASNNTNLAYDYTEGEDVPLRSKAVKVTLPEGLNFGMYMKTNGTVYSDPSLNDIAYNKDHSFAATFKNPTTGKVYFSFEDAYSSATEWDYNDILFRVEQGIRTVKNEKTDEEEVIEPSSEDPDPENPDPDPVDPEDPEDPEVPEEDTPLSWLIAAEDLGTTDDFDFNDVVFSITSVTTNADSETPVKSIKVKALAAGGTLPVWLHFVSNSTDYVVAPNAGSEGNPLVLASEAGEDHEWHQAWFGRDYSLMLNTGQREATGAEVTLPSDITIDFSVEDYSSHVSTGMKGFYISVTDPNPGNNVQNVGGAANGYAIVGSAPSEGMAHAPQMFLIPDAGAESVGGKWCWPSERRHILEVYPSFKEWVGDAAGASTWYLTAPTPSTYYSR